MDQDFYTLTHMSIAGIPDGVVGIHSQRLGETYLIEPAQWGNIWVYGMEVILFGYLTYAEFRRRARRLPEGSQVLQYSRTRTENMALPMGELKPVTDLFTRVRNWAKSQR